jgi:hypothetical protein
MEKKRWSAEQDELLKESYSSLLMPELMKKLNRTRASIAYRAFSLGLRRPEGFIYNIREEGYNRSNPFDESFFDSVDSEIKAYLLGLIYTDGCIHFHKKSLHYRLIYDIQESDYELIGLFLDSLQATKHKVYKRLSKGTIRVEFSSKRLCESLMGLGIVRRKSYTNVFPTSIRDDFMRHYIRGCFDGDGCISFSKRHNSGVITLTGRTLFCKWVQGILATHGIKTRVNQYKHDIDRSDLKISNRLNNSLFAQWLYKDATFFLSRKYNKFVEGGLL